MKAILADMRATAQAHEQWAQSAEASSSEAATSTVFATQIRAWIESLDKLAEALTACQQERDAYRQRQEVVAGLLDAKYLNPGCTVNGCQWLSAQRALEEVAVALGYPREMAAAPCNAVAHHAKAVNDALTVTQVDLTACRAQGEAMRAALVAAEQFVHPDISRGPAVNGWSNTMQLVTAALSSTPTEPKS